MLLLIVNTQHSFLVWLFNTQHSQYYCRLISATFDGRHSTLVPGLTSPHSWSARSVAGSCFAYRRSVGSGTAPCWSWTRRWRGWWCCWGRWRCCCTSTACLSVPGSGCPARPASQGAPRDLEREHRYFNYYFSYIHLRFNDASGNTLDSLSRLSMSVD